MDIGVIFNIASLCFLLLIMVVYLSKKRIETSENKIFNKLLFISLIGLVVGIPLYFIVKDYQNPTILTLIIPKVYLIYLVAWTYYLSLYVSLISHSGRENKFYNILNKILPAYLIICSIIIFALPIEYCNTNGIYTFGATVNFTYVICGINILYWLISYIIFFKKIKSKKCIPIIAVYALGTIVAILQKSMPEVRLMTSTITFITCIMYFTIENPDIKMVNELYKNKDILEETYVEKSNFLFEITQEVRNPLFDIKKTCEEAKKSKDIKAYSSALERIEKYSKQLDFIVNDVLNVSTLDSNLVKFIDNKYNFNLICNQVIASIKDTISPKVRFNYNISNDIPMLYGDSIKVKQIISSLLKNSIEHTKDGFIDLSVNTIERFDAIRLIIKIKDSSKGMPIDVVNDILNTTASLDKTEIELLERNEISVNLCQKIVKLMGGNLLIKSTEKRGTEVILTIDQKIDDKVSSLGLYEEYRTNEKKVAIVTQDKKLNEYLRKSFNTNDIKNTIILNGNYLIDDIKAGKHFDYIILASEMEEINGFTIFQKLQEIENFRTPIILLINDKSMKKHYLEEGFNDVILLSDIENELPEIIAKY